MAPPGWGTGKEIMPHSSSSYFLFSLSSYHCPFFLFLLLFFFQCRSFMDHLHGCWGGGVGPRWPQTTSHPLLSRVDNPAAFNFHQVESQDRLPRSKTCGTLTSGTGVGLSWTAAPLLLAISSPLIISETKRRIQLVIAPGDK